MTSTTSPIATITDGTLDILEQVRLVFDADRQTDQSIRKAAPAALVRWN